MYTNLSSLSNKSIQEARRLLRRPAVLSRPKFGNNSLDRPNDGMEVLLTNGVDTFAATMLRTNETSSLSLYRKIFRTMTGESTYLISSTEDFYEYEEHIYAFSLICSFRYYLLIEIAVWLKRYEYLKNRCQIYKILQTLANIHVNDKTHFWSFRCGAKISWKVYIF